MMGGISLAEQLDISPEIMVSPVSLTSVPEVHPETALQKVAGRWLAATPDDRLHTFEGANGVSEVGEHIVGLIDGVRTVEQIIAAVVHEFEVSFAVAERDTRQFIGLLISKQVLRIV
jgi:hypothetical protein